MPVQGNLNRSAWPAADSTFISHLTQCTFPELWTVQARGKSGLDRTLTMRADMQRKIMDFAALTGDGMVAASLPICPDTLKRLKAYENR